MSGGPGPSGPPNLLGPSDVKELARSKPATARRQLATGQLQSTTAQRRLKLPQLTSSCLISSGDGPSRLKLPCRQESWLISTDGRPAQLKSSRRQQRLPHLQRRRPLSMEMSHLHEQCLSAVDNVPPSTHLGRRRLTASAVNSAEATRARRRRHWGRETGTNPKSVVIRYTDKSSSCQ